MHEPGGTCFPGRGHGGDSASVIDRVQFVERRSVTRTGRKERALGALR